MMTKMSWIVLLASMLVAVTPGAAQEVDFEFEVLGPFDARQLPYLTDELRERWKNYVDQYPDIIPTLVVAVSESGNSGSWWGSDRNRKDRVRNAMHQCEHRSGSACGLAVVDGEMVKFTILPRQLTYPERFDSTVVPFVTDPGVAHIEENYAEQPEHKALALNWTGSFGYSHERGGEDEARENALELCRKFSEEQGNCFLYDVNGKVVFTPETDVFGNR